VGILYLPPTPFQVTHGLSIGLFLLQAFPSMLSSPCAYINY